MVGSLQSSCPPSRPIWEGTLAATSENVATASIAITKQERTLMEAGTGTIANIEHDIQVFAVEDEPVAADLPLQR